MSANGQDRTFKHGRFMPLGDPVQQPVSRIDSLRLHSPKRESSDGFAIADNHLTFSKISEQCRPCPQLGNVCFKNALSLAGVNWIEQCNPSLATAKQIQKKDAP